MLSRDLARTDSPSGRSLPRAVCRCLGQSAAATAEEMVVFVARPDLYRKHAREVLHFEQGNIERNFPEEKHAKYQGRMRMYYGRLMPLLYARAAGLHGLWRKVATQVVGLFRPIVRQVGEGDMRTVIHKSLGMVVESFMLAMSEAGYDTCPLEGFDSLRVRRILGIPHGAQVSVIVSCGVRLPKGVRGERYRLPFEQIYHRL